MSSASSLSASQVELDIAIIGGGVAGLWLLNRLCTLGYNAVLFEATALGSEQTAASQGMIHSGIKYTLSGALSAASEAIASMPAQWHACLRGEGDVDLRRANILSHHFYMWSSNTVTSRLTAFFASKAMRDRVEAVGADDRPKVLQHPDFKGSLYRLMEIVLDVPSVIAALAANTEGRVFKLTPGQSQWLKNSNGAAQLHIHTSERKLTVHAQRFVFTAGKGNASLLHALDIQQPRMQTRPLQQVLVQHDYPHRFYGHCLGTDTTPRLTISSHPGSAGKQVWNLGGSLAEKGAGENPDSVIARAKAELKTLMPWVDLRHARWATLPIDRAEPRQMNAMRPDKAFAGSAEGIDNVIVAWPTKLTLSPNLANEVVDRLDYNGISPSQDRSQGISALAKLSVLPVPALAPAPWDTAFGAESC